MFTLLFFGIIFVVSFFLTRLIYGYALKKRLIDEPNIRGSHNRPTPRAGGLSIAVLFLASIGVFAITGKMPQAPFLALFVGGLMVAGIGFLDDHGHVLPRWRILVHFIAAAWALWWIGGLPQVQLGATIWQAGWIGHLLALLFVVWLLNLFNFMDGIDGVAGVETITVSAGAALILLDDGNLNIPLWLGVLAAATAGFLIWNWPPAKLFMGDSGSGFLGFVFGVLVIYTANVGLLSPWIWAILLAVFVCDSTFTLIRRVGRREKWYAAHRSHGYQRLALHLHSHLKVTVGVSAINVVWLLPLAWLAHLFPDYELLLAAIAYVPLIILARVLGAGKNDQAAFENPPA